MARGRTYGAGLSAGKARSVAGSVASSEREAGPMKTEKIWMVAKDGEYGSRDFYRDEKRARRECALKMLEDVQGDDDDVAMGKLFDDYVASKRFAPKLKLRRALTDKDVTAIIRRYSKYDHWNGDDQASGYFIESVELL